MHIQSQRKTWIAEFRRTLAYLWPHRRTLMIGLIAAVGVSVFYTVSVSSVIPILKIIFAEHETLADWIHRIDTQRRLDVVIADNMPDDPEGLLVDHVRPESRSADVLESGDRIVSVAGLAPGSHELMRIIADERDKQLGPVVVDGSEGRRTVELTLRQYHWWSRVLRSVGAILPSGKDPTSRLKTLALVMAALVVLALLGGLCRLANEGLIAIAVQRALHDLRTALADHVFRLPVNWHSAQAPGDTLGRFANDISKVETGMLTLLGKVVCEPLKATGILVLTLLIDWRLLVVAVSGLPIGIIAMRWFGRAVKRSQKRASQSWGRLLDHLGEKIAGIRVVKAYGMQDEERRRFELEGRTLTRAQTNIEVVDAATKPVLETLAVFAAALFVIYGGTRVFSNKLEPHLFFAAVVCLGGLYDPVRKLGNVNNRLQQADASAKRLFELLDTRLEETSTQARGVELKALRERIEFHNVSFAYPQHPERLVLANIDLTVERGQVVALVGPNGAGKTTLLALLMRFYEPTAGHILIDGVDVSRVRLDSLRSQIGLVTQDAVIFTDTVRGNIAYAPAAACAATADVDEAVRGAARLAHVDDFIQTLRVPDNGTITAGYDAHITARMLSGGQRQRIALARAIYCDPSILILDEATSQIDSESEQKIQAALEDVTRGRTTFIIAHRFSTIARADLIVVLNDGHMVACGGHAELMESSPFYAKLCQTQFAVAM